MDHSYDFIAGCLGGAAGVFVGHPFDTIKVRLQLQCQKNPLYRGTFDCLKKIIIKEGHRGPYKGITSPLYSLTAINAIIFGVQGNVLRRMEEPDSLKSHFISGTLAVGIMVLGCVFSVWKGFVQCSICGPMELVKTRMQMQGQGEKIYKQRNVVYKSTLDCLHKIYRAEGFKGLCRGMNATVVREVPAFGFYFLSYEWLCRFFTPEGGLTAPTWALLVSGGLAGCVAWIVSYPVDVIKSRIQADGSYRKGKFTYQYSGYLDCVRKSIASEGYGVFSRGLNSTLIRAFPTNAATFTVVAWSLRILRPDDTQAERQTTIDRATMITQLD